MKLNIKKREKAAKTEVKQLRRDGDIPAVLYSSKSPGQNIVIKGDEFDAVLRMLKLGELSTVIFTLVDQEGNECRAIVKDIHYHVTTYDIIHLDFLQLFDTIPVNINIPVRCTNVESCAGVKLGGVVRQVIRSCLVRCLPGDIPREFTFDIKDLALHQSFKLKHLDIPENIRPLSQMNEVAVVIVKR